MSKLNPYLQLITVIVGAIMASVGLGLALGFAWGIVLGGVAVMLIGTETI